MKKTTKKPQPDHNLKPESLENEAGVLIFISQGKNLLVAFR
jgi:hypothetical protein